MGQIDRVFRISSGHQAHAGARDFSQLGFDRLPLIEGSDRQRDFGMSPAAVRPAGEAARIACGVPNRSSSSRYVTFPTPRTSRNASQERQWVCCSVSVLLPPSAAQHEENNSSAVIPLLVCSIATAADTSEVTPPLLLGDFT